MALDINATWLAASGASAYVVGVRINSGIETEYVVETTSFYLAGFSVSDLVDVRVKSRNDFGDSNWSDVTPITILGALPTPLSGLSATGITNGIRLDWDDNSTNETEFGIYRSEGGGGNASTWTWTLIHTTAPNIETYSDTLTEGVTRYYIVIAVSPRGANPTLDNSYAMYVTSMAGAVPDVPASFTATTLSSTSIQLDWLGVVGIDDYRIERSLDGSTGWSNIATIPVGTLTHDDTLLNSNTQYFYRIRARAGTLYSNYSANTNDYTLLTTPNATAATSVVITSFTANWDAVAGATSYRLDVSLFNTFVSFVGIYNDLTVDATNQSVTGLSSATTYYYRVRAYNVNSTSESSNIITQGTLPEAPTATAATSVTTTSFTANWNDVTGATSYRLDVSTLDGMSLVYVVGYQDKSVSGTSHSVTGLTAGTEYYYVIRAVSAGGTSANSNSITQSTLPIAPTFSAATSVTTTSFTANWGAVTGATSYRLDVSTVNTFASFVAGYENLSVAGVSQSITGLSSETTYYYRARTVGAGGTSANSNTASQATNAAVPDPPTGLSVVDEGSGRIGGSWNSVAGALEYIYRYNVDGGAFSLGISTALTTSFTDLGIFADNSSVCVQVAVRTEGGWSAWSSSVCTIIFNPA